MYFNKKHFRESYADRTQPMYQTWFMHEMVHVWQFQLGYPVKWRGALRVGLSYAYTLAPEKRLGDYNMEAQGDIVADYFALEYLKNPGVVRQENYATVHALPQYRQVLQEFLKDPSNKISLP
ncbi:hypothetical protein [Stenotrophomonas sp. MMGLT7]|uniref:hypothetical protein n=1 Tax=Stenotrophomonas sp. MMGLT7 TaxID=2901227 RepID=UPI001E3CEF81|nr:hypothetical protein [Stenotrophomonas sp. MMGLT7]MCD7099068.1 hypothetical protein [Stenotrophomonas sp. MMGLT7]